MADRLYAGAQGVPIRLVLLDDGVLHDPSSALLLRMAIRRPDGSELTVSSPAVTVGETSGRMAGENGTPRPCLEYYLNERLMAGPYRVQGYIEDGSGKWPAEPTTIRVEPSMSTFES